MEDREDDTPIEEVTLGEDVRALLRADIEREVETRADQWSEFSRTLLARIERKVAEEPESSLMTGLLRADSARELESREGQWSAFTEGVRRRIGEEARKEARAPLDVRAIATLKDEVAAELEEIAPRFERRFAAELAERIETEGDGFFARAWSRLREWISAPAGRWALAGAVAAGLAAAILLAPQPSEDIELAAWDRSVRVDQLSFEGTVTVMNREGVAVIWLARSE